MAQLQETDKLRQELRKAEADYREREADVKRIREQLRKQLRRSEAEDARPLDLLPPQDHYAVSGASHRDGNAVKGRASIPRSKSTAGHAAMMPRTMERSHTTHSPKRPRTLSQHSAPTLNTRSLSRTMESSKNPFSAREYIPPLEANSHAMITRFSQSHDDPANVLVMQSYMDSLAEDPAAAPAIPAVGVDVGVYLDNVGALDSPAMIPPPQRSLLFPHRASFQGQVLTACPSMVSGPSTAETGSLMERNPSCSDTSLSALGMTRVASGTSQQTDGYLGQEINYNSSHFSSYKGDAGDPLVFVGAGFTNQYASSAPVETFFHQHSPAMERSFSNMSAQSNSSNRSRRAKEVHQRHIENGKRSTILPKPPDLSKSRHSAEAEAAKKSGKRALVKTNYQRPRHPKVFCTQCNEKSDGFRGEHELRRHTLAKHEGIVKKWRCRDAVKAGLKPTISVVNQLSKCKQCSSGKLYGAYYNAAAHLRRTHFKPKTPRGKRKSEEDEKRGGSGGGDWPPMPDLKLWFEEVMVDLNKHDVPEDLDDAEEDTVFNDSPELDSASFLGTGFEDYEPQSFNSMLDLGVDTSCTSTVVMPISSASSGFDFRFSPTSPLTGVPLDYEQASSIYGGSAVSSSTMTPTNYQMSHMSDEFPFVIDV